MINNEINKIETIHKEGYGKVYFIPPDNEGFFCGYSLFIPEGCNMDTTLLVHSCNTGKCGNTLEEALNDAKNNSIGDKHMDIACDLKIPVLTPIIPRFKGFYSHYLSSKVVNNNFDDLIKENINLSELNDIIKMVTDLPNQLVNMINHSKTFLSNLGISIDDKVIIEGYSAGSKFANGFTALHPELVKACICGGNSGISIMPNKDYNYPLGFKDISDGNLELYLKIPKYNYIGNIDDNDPAKVTDKIIDGLMQPYYSDCYTPLEVTIINKVLGNNVQDRYDKLKEIYKDLPNNIFDKFNGNHSDLDPYHYQCILNFINGILKNNEYTDSDIKIK